MILSDKGTGSPFVFFRLIPHDFFLRYLALIPIHIIRLDGTWRSNRYGIVLVLVDKTNYTKREMELIYEQPSNASADEVNALVAKAEELNDKRIAQMLGKEYS